MFWVWVSLAMLAVAASSIVAGLMISGRPRPRRDHEDTPLIPDADEHNY